MVKQPASVRGKPICMESSPRPVSAPHHHSTRHRFSFVGSTSGAAFVLLLLLVVLGFLIFPGRGGAIALALQEHPNAAFLATVLGAVCLYIEFLYPGLILPGVLGAGSLLLGISALGKFPLNGGGVALLALALVLFAVAARRHFYGIPGIAGVAAMAAGAVFLVEASQPGNGISVAVAIAGAVGFGVATVMLLSLAARATRNKAVGTATGPMGIALDPLNPKGRVRLDGEIWHAVSSAPVAQGARVRIRTIRNLILEVEPVFDPGANSSSALDRT